MKKTLVALLLFSSSPFATAKDNKEEVPYKVQFSDRLPAEVSSTIEEHSSLFTLSKRLPTSMAALRFRAEMDIPRIQEILYAFGYYDSKIEIDFSKRYDKTILVVFHIDLKERYLLENFRIVNVEKLGKVDPTALISPKRIGIQIGEGMNAYKVLSAERLLVRRLGHIGYPFAKIENKEVVVDPKNKTVSVTLRVEPGAFAYFGKVHIEGLKKVSPQYAQYLIAWKEGKPFDLFLIDQTRESYFNTSLFSYVSINYPTTVDPKNPFLPISVQVRESLFRSFNLGVNYATIDGYGFSAGWEHRNLRGLGQKLSIQADISVKTKLISIVYKEPNIKRRGEFLTWKAATGKNKYISYQAETISLKRRVDRNVNPHFKRAWSGSLEYLYSKTPYAHDHYLLLSLPVSFRWNTTKDRLNPSSGTIFELGVEPTLDLRNFATHYLQNHFSFAFFLPFSPAKRAVVAFRAFLGTILASSLGRVPPPKRFYAGTEELLRGYTYLTVSPLNAAGNPIGGRSIMAYNLELRFTSTEGWGFVLFYDFGQVYTQTFFKLNNHLFHSVGAGLRYFTLAGPISVDFAFPLNPRRGLEHSVLKIYVTIGQTF